MAPGDIRYDVPLYGIVEAAKHLRMSQETLRRWVRRGDLITSLSPETPRSASLPFVAMAEAQFFLKLKSDGLTLPAIADGMAAVRRELGPKMLQRGRLAHDGRDILMDLSDETVAAEWERARDRQGGIQGIIEHALEPITWADDGLPQTVRLEAYEGANVTIDPRFAFGQPVVEELGVRTEDIIDMWLAGDPMAEVADEFGLRPETVEAIVRTHGLAA